MCLKRLLIVIVLLGVIPSLSFAGNRNVFKLVEIIIEDEFIHLGDDDDFGVPRVPTGIEYEQTFRIFRRDLAGARDAHIQIVISDVQTPTWKIVINEHSLIIPFTDRSELYPNLPPTIVSIPLAWLKRNINIISIEPIDPAATGFDDIFFTDIRLVISKQ